MNKCKSVILTILFALAVRGSVVQTFVIPSESMRPTLEVGDRIIVNRLSYGFRPPYLPQMFSWSEPQVGDVIVFTRPGDSRYLVKRVAEVLSTGVFVLGDNHTNSFDSRFWPDPIVPFDNVEGEVIARFWPLERASLTKHWEQKL